MRLRVWRSKLREPKTWAAPVVIGIVGGALGFLNPPLPWWQAFLILGTAGTITGLVVERIENRRARR